MSATPLVVCPHCRARNRVPVARLAQRPMCGRCKRVLFEAMPVALDAESLDAHVLGGELPVLVDFWAPWCGPCQSMAPHFQQAAAQLEPQVRLAKVDTQAQPALGTRFGIRGIPTLVLFHLGREIARHSGAMRTAEITAWTRSHLP